MRTPLLALVLLLALGSTAPGQAKTLVSPINATTVDGSSANVFPFVNSTARRYQQVHADLGAGVKTISKLAFRLSSGSGNRTGVRTIDLEMFMGMGRSLASTSYVFASNYLTPRTRVITRKKINWGPQGTQRPGLNPFNTKTQLLLDRPFKYAGDPRTLVWEVVVFSNTQTTPGSMTFQDADHGAHTLAPTIPTGIGCAGMTLKAQYVGVGRLLAMNNQVLRAPASAPTVLAIGVKNPHQLVPGMCSNLLTDTLLILPLGKTDASGSITPSMAGQSTFVLPNTFTPGVKMFLQAHSAEPSSSSSIKIRNSNGLAVVAPPPSTAKVVRVARIYNDVGGTAATQGIWSSTSTLGYGLVTQITYQ